MLEVCMLKCTVWYTFTNRIPLSSLYPDQEVSAGPHTSPSGSFPSEGNRYPDFSCTDGCILNIQVFSNKWIPFSNFIITHVYICTVIIESSGSQSMVWGPHRGLRPFQGVPKVKTTSDSNIKVLFAFSPCLHLTLQSQSSGGKGAGALA